LGVPKLLHVDCFLFVLYKPKNILPDLSEILLYLISLLFYLLLHLWQIILYLRVIKMSFFWECWFFEDIPVPLILFKLLFEHFLIGDINIRMLYDTIYNLLWAWSSQTVNFINKNIS
jgi:hypothetical protein